MKAHFLLRDEKEEASQLIYIEGACEHCIELCKKVDDVDDLCIYHPGKRGGRYGRKLEITLFTDRFRDFYSYDMGLVSEESILPSCPSLSNRRRRYRFIPLEYITESQFETYGEIAGLPSIKASTLICESRKLT